MKNVLPYNFSLYEKLEVIERFYCDKISIIKFFFEVVEIIVFFSGKVVNLTISYNFSVHDIRNQQEEIS